MLRRTLRALCLPMAEYEERRAALFSSLPRHSVAVVVGAPRVPRHDVEPRFEQDASLRYLTGAGNTTGVGAAVFVRTYRDERRWFLFGDGPDPTAELWHGPRLTAATAALPCGATHGFGMDDLGRVTGHVVAAMRADVAPLVYLHPPQAVPVFRSHCDAAAALAAVDGSAPVPASPAFHGLVAALQGCGYALSDPAFHALFPQPLGAVRADISPAPTMDAAEEAAAASVDATAAAAPAQADAARAAASEVRHAATQQRLLAALRRHRAAESTRWVRPAFPLLQRLRSVKRPREVALIADACAATAAGFDAAMALTQRTAGVSERHLEATLAAAAVGAGAGGLGYVPVVAGGPRATALHYIGNDRVLRAGELVTVDAGASVAGYTADCTRAWPVGGAAFSPAQRRVHDAVHGIQAALLKATVPGAAVAELQLSFMRLAYAALLRLGVLVPRPQQGTSGDPKGAVNSDPLLVQSLFAPHQFGHHVGAELHEDAPHTLLLEEGAVHTVEPGLYIPRFADASHLGPTPPPPPEGAWWLPQTIEQPSSAGGVSALPWAALGAAVPPELQGIGVRLEDMVHVTAAPTVMTAAIPRSADEIEARLRALALPPA